MGLGIGRVHRGVVCGILRGHRTPKLTAYLKIRDNSHATVQQLPVVQLFCHVNSGRPSNIPSLLTIQLRKEARELLVDIGTILSLAYLTPEGAQHWLVNSRIDFTTFNKIY